MSLLYINPGFPSLFEDGQFNYYQNTDSKYTNCKQYFIPLDYGNWHRIYSNYRMISVYFRFDMYINLTANGTSYSNEFASFLKEVFGQLPNQQQKP